jgi:hypothetical protein
MTMGVLVELSTGKRIYLLADHFIGRSSRADLRLDAATVSHSHASIRWTGGAWEVLDLGSRNGTYADHHRVTPASRAYLHEGTVLTFGDEANAWRFECGKGPVAQAQLVEDGQVISTVPFSSGLLSLENNQEEPLCVYYEPSKGWLCEREGECLPVVNGQILQYGAQSWLLRLPQGTTRTQTASESLSLEAGTLHFRVSRDEERVQLLVRYGSHTIDLEERAHHYTLLTLARLRLRDAELGSLTISEQGWVASAECASMLRIEPTRLNIDIHRARKQLSAAKIVDAHRIVERKLRPHCMRLGTRRIDITTV